MVDLEAGYLAGAHNEYYDFEVKRQRAQTEGVKAWIDPEGYRRFVAGKKRAFENEVDEELGVPKAERSERHRRNIGVEVPTFRL